MKAIQRTRRRHPACAALIGCAFLSTSAGIGCKSGSRAPQVTPPGQETTPETSAAKAGAEVIQSNEPTDKLDIYLVGFHLLNNDPSHQMEAHHYCYQVNEDFAQCVLFDSNGEDANLNGIEYIISEKLFDGLSEEEKQYWHPHNYEILSGQLVAPGLPDAAEYELMEGKMNSYGKTWHTWRTGSAVSDGVDFPEGPSNLAWSFNADGEAKQGLVERRDQAMEINTADVRRKRQDLVKRAKPQRGVDLMADEFPNRNKPAGVEAKSPDKSDEAKSPDEKSDEETKSPDEDEDAESVE